MKILILVCLMLAGCNSPTADDLLRTDNKMHMQVVDLCYFWNKKDAKREHDCVNNSIVCLETNDAKFCIDEEQHRE